MSKITAVATLGTKMPQNDGQTTLNFYADYNDERNKAWSKYTPGMSAQLLVIDSVAEKFEQGGRYLLTFEKKD
jgi:hypothetical protein